MKRLWWFSVGILMLALFGCAIEVGQTENTRLEPLTTNTVLTVQVPTTIGSILDQ